MSRLKKNYFKTIMRSLRAHLGRFLAILGIIFLAGAIIAGLGNLAYSLERTFSDEMVEQNVPDVILKTKAGTFTDAQIAQVKGNNDAENVEELTSFDFANSAQDNIWTRLYIYPKPLGETKINKIKLIEGQWPQNQNEVVVEQPSEYAKRRAIGETYEAVVFGIPLTNCKIVGIVANPLLLTKAGEYSANTEDLTQPGHLLQEIVYSEKSLLPIPPNLDLTTDLYVSLKKTSPLLFSGKYLDWSAKKRDDLVNSLNDEQVMGLTLQENQSFMIVKGYSDNMRNLGYIFSIYFIAVCALVVASTMSRFIAEERAIIGCLKTLGFTNFQISLKYLSFVLLSSLVGAAAGCTLGLFLLPYVIFPSMHSALFFPPLAWAFDLLPACLGSIGVLAVSLFITGLSLINILKETPAALLRPKAPPPGKKVFLEHISFIWHHLAFRYKSTMRNILRYKGRTATIIISIAGAIALILTGFGITDLAETVGTTDTIRQVAAVAILFSLALCILVIYNITNINIGERQREIATLKILGYRPFEVYTYIYREIFIAGFVGELLGLPLGYGFLSLLSYMVRDFGSVNSIKWYSYLWPLGIGILAFLLVDICMAPKIKKINMISSLQTWE